ncbi:hypothetical protein SDRG_01763 [Saprolegnia diclina VS20]|uniref:NACHT domain-containing protein n=1 Tax=Saprolegnia diclina (strain VS20) TaxID=1156394 RepID=T0SCU1_SAPDV|nr:hypothetical protein SDRG_01763 [Saprolegnia diclina VS20]EQC40687.1 hypothetical protein SDRG_01763 [Saprolegnia diclina VS20]|eukprot:XP_008605531.1 hypothetical protein SDRG_01763 [Saprolegnia diclina VS20]
MALRSCARVESAASVHHLHIASFLQQRRHAHAMAKFFRRSSSKMGGLRGDDVTASMPRERVTLSGVTASAVTASNYSSYQLDTLHETVASMNKQLDEYKRETIARLDHVEGSVRESTRRAISNQATNHIVPAKAYRDEPTGFENTSDAPAPSMAMDAAVDEMKRHVDGIRRDVMMELHTTKYDLLKEMTMLRGAVMQLVDAMHQQSTPRAVATPLLRTEDRKLSVMSDATVSSEADSEDSTHEEPEVFEPNPKVPYLPAASRTPSPPKRESTVFRESTRASSKLSRESSKLSRESSKLSRESSKLSRESSKLLFRESTRQPIKDQALTQPWENVLNQHLPFLNTQRPAMEMLPSTRTWAINQYIKWAQDAGPTNESRVLNVVGGAGAGKSTLLSHLVSNYPEQIMASHFVRYDERHAPSAILMSLAHQISCKLPDYQQQLVRLNLPYLIQEPDPIVLATKLLIEPLRSMPAPLESQVIVLDAVDEDVSTPGANLISLLADVALEFPSWVLFLLSSRLVESVLKALPAHDVLHFHMEHRPFAADCTIAVQSVMDKHGLDDKNILFLLKAKSQGSFLYLQFVDQAFSMIHSEIDAGMILELPKTLHEIYDQVFEEKYGKGRRRVWQKVQAVLEAIVGAATISHEKNACPFVTESDVQHIFKLGQPDLALIARSFEDIVTVDEDTGVYRLQSKGLFDYLVDTARSQEVTHINVERGIHYLTKGNVPYKPSKKPKVTFDV